MFTRAGCFAWNLFVHLTCLAYAQKNNQQMYLQKLDMNLEF